MLSLLAVLLFIVLFFAQEIFHRYPRFTLVFFLSASIILLPCWVLLIGVDNWFGWVKVLSIASGVIVLSLFRTTKLGKGELMPVIVYIFLVANMLEAVIKDIMVGSSVNYINAFAGILLIATLNRINTIHIDVSGKYRDLHWGSMTLLWIVGYTLWNWVFVYLNLSVQSSIIHIAVLGSALVVGFVDRERWLQARAFTLGLYFIIFHTYPHMSVRLFSNGYDEQVGLISSFVALGFMLVYVGFFVWQKVFKGKNRLSIK